MSNVLVEDAKQVFDEIMQRQHWDGFPPPPEDGDDGNGGGGDGGSRWSWWLRRIFRILSKTVGTGFVLLGVFRVVQIICQMFGLLPVHP